MSPKHTGPGWDVLDDLRTQLITDEWVHDRRDGFDWTPGQLTTQFTVTNLGVEAGDQLDEVRVSTLVLRNVQAPNVAEALNEINTLSCGDSYYFEETTGSVRAHMAFVVYPGSVPWVRLVARRLVATSIDIANRTVADLAERLHGEVAFDGHPELGRRRTPNEVIGSVGGPNWPSKLGPYGVESWQTIVDRLGAIGLPVVDWKADNKWLMLAMPFPADASRTSLSEIPAMLLVSTFGNPDLAPHPIAGVDLGIRLGVPVFLESALDAAAELNRAPSSYAAELSHPLNQPPELPAAHQLGAWYADENGMLWLVLRLPNAALPNDMDDQLVVITNLVLGQLARAQYALKIPAEDG